MNIIKISLNLDTLSLGFSTMLEHELAFNTLGTGLLEEQKFNFVFK